MNTIALVCAAVVTFVPRLFSPLQQDESKQKVEEPVKKNLADVGKMAVEMPVKRLIADARKSEDEVPLKKAIDPARPKEGRVAPGRVQWHASFDKAIEAAAKSGKPVLLFQMLGQLDEEWC